jgi:vancomycin resistance protein VanJ
VIDPADPAGSITVASQNVEAASGTAAASGLALADRGADIIALEELTASSRTEASAALAASHPYSYTVGTVGLWSIYPLDDVRALSLGLSWQRALTASVRTPAGPVSVYVVHAASIRPGKQVDRDVMIAQLARTIAADTSERVLAVGDFNAASTDPALQPVTADLDEPNQSASSLGFTWPAAMPAARIDHIFERGLAATSNIVAAAGDSDHLAVIARFTL